MKKKKTLMERMHLPKKKFFELKNEKKSLPESTREFLGVPRFLYGK